MIKKKTCFVLLFFSPSLMAFMSRTHTQTQSLTYAVFESFEKRKQKQVSWLTYRNPCQFGQTSLWKKIDSYRTEFLFTYNSFADASFNMQIFMALWCIVLAELLFLGQSVVFWPRGRVTCFFLADFIFCWHSINLFFMNSWRSSIHLNLLKFCFSLIILYLFHKFDLIWP